MLVGGNHRLTQSTKVYVDTEGETSALKRWNVDGMVILGSCGFYQRAVVRSFRQVCVMLSAVGVAVNVLSRSLSRLTTWTFVNHFIVAFRSNQLQNLWRGKVLIGWKKEKNLLIVNIKLHFNWMGARSLPAQWRILFILVSAIVLWGLKASCVAVCYLTPFWVIIFSSHFCFVGLTS